MADNARKQDERQPEVGVVFDAIVVGAGFAGLYMLHRLRGLGFTARVYEAGGGVGGTWYWNRYPGARCDVESMQYSFSFSEELDQQWDWSEKYSPQPEILAYANHVTDRFNLRPDIRFNTRVTSATFDEAKNCWHVETDRGDRVSAKFCIMAVGCLSATNRPPFAGIDDFKGPIYHTGEWPHDGVDFTGLRVGVIGTGSSAIQSIPIIAQQAAELTVFQRTATYTVPAWNEKLTPEYRQKIKADYPALRAKARARPTGFYFPFNMKPALEASPEEREQKYEEAWERGGLPFLGAFGDLLFEKAANDTIADFARAKIRGIVKDPATAELLCPDNVFGCKRLCVDTGYFETYNLPHVRLVDVSKTPIERFTKEGIEVNGTEYPRRRDRLRDRFRRDDRLVRPHQNHRPQRADAGGEMARRSARLSRRRVKRLSQSVHDHRPGQSVGTGEHDPGDRTACRLDAGLHGASARRRSSDLRADPAI